MDCLPYRLRALRKRSGLTQSQLAGIIGVAQAYIAELERGKKRPSLDVLERLCDSLGCSADYLLGVSPGRYAALPPCALSPQNASPSGGPVLSPVLLAEIGSSGITDEELRLALKLVRVMREKPLKA